MASTSNIRNRSSRKKHVKNKFDNLESLTLSDVQCTACMGIFIEPVTLPCNHAMCKECFQKTIDNNPLSCPLCRMYIGAWIRKVQKSGKLVNDRLWLHVQTTFTPHVQKKLAGEEDEEMEDLARQFLPGPHLSEPGEIRQEYEAEQERLRDEARKREQAEAEASKKLILQLQEVEEAKKELERRELQKREEEDARIARQLAEEESQRHEKESEAEVRSAFVSLQKKSTSLSGQPIIRGPMDAFVSQSSKGPSLSRTDSACSNDSLHSELQHFKPLVTAPCTPPKRLPNGKSERSLPILVPVMRDLEAALGSSRLSVGTLSSPLRPWELSDKKEESLRGGRSTADSSSSSSGATWKRRNECPSINSPSAKRACTEYDEDDDEGYAGSDRSKEQDSVAEVDAGGLSLSAAELRLQLAASERLRQEMLDRDMALRLQAELDAESAPVYQLRSGDAKTTPPRKAPPRKKPVSASKDNRRQRTLEETMAVSRHSLRTTLK